MKIYIQWNPSKLELSKTGNPSKLNDFVSLKFLSSYLNYPSKPNLLLSPEGVQFRGVALYMQLVKLFFKSHFNCNIKAIKPFVMARQWKIKSMHTNKLLEHSDTDHSMLQYLLNIFFKFKTLLKIPNNSFKLYDLYNINNWLTT